MSVLVALLLTAAPPMAIVVETFHQGAEDRATPGRLIGP
jgi:hypothetical protein